MTRGPQDTKPGIGPGMLFGQPYQTGHSRFCGRLAPRGPSFRKSKRPRVRRTNIWFTMEISRAAKHILIMPTAKR